MTFRQTPAGEGRRHGRCCPGAGRGGVRSLFLRLLQQGDLVRIQAGRQAKMASRVAQLYQGPVDRRVGVDGIEGAARAFEGFRTQRFPVNALAMQGMLPHDVDGVVKKSRSVRRDLSTVLRRGSRLLASQA